MQSLTLEQWQAWRPAAIISAISVIYVFVNLMLLRVVFGLTVQFWNYTDPQFIDRANASPAEYGWKS